MDLVNFAVCGYLQGWPDGSLPVYGPWPRLIRRQTTQAQLEQIHAKGSRYRDGGQPDRAFAADSVDHYLPERRHWILECTVLLSRRPPLVCRRIGRMNWILGWSTRTTG